MKLCPNDYFSWPTQSLGFAYGSIVAINRARLEKFFVRNLRIICLLCGLTLPILGYAYLYIHTPERENLSMYFLRIAMSFLLMLLFLALSVRIKIVSVVMLYIGRISVYIYLLHGLVIDILKDYLKDGCLILGCIVGAILLSICFSWIVEKIGKGYDSIKNR